MGDLISREDLIDWLTSRIIMLKGNYGDLGGAVSGVREMVKVMPSAEPEQKCAKDARCSEQAAKILNRSEGFYSAHGVCICGHCEICGNAVCDDFRFCPYCGTKLDWSGS